MLLAQLKPESLGRTATNTVMSDQHASHIPWLRILLEGVVIVVSVLLALSADAWWDGRQQQGQELSVLRGLQSDLQETLTAVAVSREAFDQVASRAEQLIALGGSRSAGVAPASVDTLLAGVINGGISFEVVDATLNALLNSEGLGVLNNAELRRQLAQWTPILARVQRSVDQNERMFQDHFMPYLYERVPVRTLDAMSRAETGVQPSAFQRDGRILLTDLRFENHLNDVLFYNRVAGARLDDLESYIHRTLTLVTAELAR